MNAGWHTPARGCFARGLKRHRLLGPSCLPRKSCVWVPARADGCPKCVLDPMCGNDNHYLDKKAALEIAGRFQE